LVENLRTKQGQKQHRKKGGGKPTKLFCKKYYKGKKGQYPRKRRGGGEKKEKGIFMGYKMEQTRTGKKTKHKQFHRGGAVV